MAKKVDTGEVMALVNDLRKLFKKKPLKRLPKGQIGMVDSCPLALAIDVLGIGVVEDGITVDSNELVKVIEEGRPARLGPLRDPGSSRHPYHDYFYRSREVARFVKAFDAGKIPELVAE